MDHATFPLASQGLEDKVKIWQARAMANGLRPLSNLITSKTPLSTVTLNHFQFPSLALMCPTLRPLLKSISSYNWPVLSICPKPQPIKVLSSLRTYLKYHLLQEGFSNFLPKLSLLQEFWLLLVLTTKIEPPCTSVWQVQISSSSVVGA